MNHRSFTHEGNENCNIRSKGNLLTQKRAFGTDLTNVILSQKPSKPINKDSLFLNEYIDDIYEHLHSTETEFLARPGYMVLQVHINEKMRSILIDWLVEVHHKFKLVDESLFLTVNIVDRFLEKFQVSREQLQLVGICSMLIACKYEEIYAPEIKDFVYITDKAYSLEEVLEMENNILRFLDFNLTMPSAFRFLQRYSNICDFDEYAFNLSRYIVELSLIEYKFLKYKPSNIAASAVFLTQKLLKSWNRTLSDKTPCSDSEIRYCAKDLSVLLTRAETYT